MGWQDLLSDGEHRVLPWVGGRHVSDGLNVWSIKGRLPEEHGWYTFNTTGRNAVPEKPADRSITWANGLEYVKGYLVGDRIIPDDARVDPDPEKLIEQTRAIFLAEPDLELFSRVSAVQVGDALVFINQDFPLGPEGAVLAAYQDQKDSVADIPNVTPALDLAFRWLRHQRVLAERRRAELERLRIEEERRRAQAERQEQALRDVGTGAGRRALIARGDFETAAKAALRVSGAELLGVRRSYHRNEMVVQYRIEHRRLECVVERDTMRVVDAGICLTSHDTGEKGDRYFTLESLPGVVVEAMREEKLVVYRHAEGDRDDRDYEDDDE